MATLKLLTHFFVLRDFPIPGALTDKVNMNTKIINARESKENVAKQHSPIATKMYSAIITPAQSTLNDSIESVMQDWFTFIRVTGLQVSEYAQMTKNKTDLYKYPSSCSVTKAFTPSNWTFYDEKGVRINVHLLNNQSDFPKK